MAPTRDELEAEEAVLVGRRLRALRALRGFKQSELAERSGVVQQHISRLEQGKGGLRVSTINKLLRALDAKPLDLTLPIE